MGVIKKQAFQSSVLIYIGTLIAFLTTGLMAPNLLEKSEIGTLRLLQSYSAVAMSLGIFGFSTITIRFLPIFFNRVNKQYNGFFGITLIVGSIGSILATVVIFIIKPVIIENNIDKSPEFAQYFLLIIPLAVFQIYYTLFDSYNNALSRSSYGVFLRDFIQRILILVGLILVLMQLFDFGKYIYFFTAALCLPTILMLIHIIRHNAFDIKINFDSLKRPMIASMVSVGLFGMLNNFSGIAVIQIDTIMLNMYLDSTAVGIYAITFYFGTLVIIPARALNKIAPTLIAKAYKDNDLETVKDVYYKSSGNLFLIGVLILLGLFVNLENVFNLIPKTYEEGKYVIILIGFANLIKMAAGSNDAIIIYSKYYKMTTVFFVIMILFIIILNFIFIPLFGMNGAALASLLAILIHNLMKFIFIKVKFDFNPYNLQYLLVLLISAIVYLVVSFSPDIDNFIIEIVVDSISATILFYFGIRYLAITHEINDFINQIFERAIKIIRSKFK